MQDDFDTLEWNQIPSDLQSLLLDTAYQIQNLLQSPQAKERFREQIQWYMDLLKDYYAEPEKPAVKAKESKKTDYAAADRKPNPLEWGRLPKNVNVVDDLVDQLYGEKQRKPTDDEILMCQYVLLIVIHDRLSEMRSVTAFYFSDDRIEKGTDEQEIARNIWDKFKRVYDKRIQRIKAEKIKGALVAVKADLVNLKPAETGQENKAGKKLSQWKPPKGYIGSKTIVNNYKIPRSTLQGWAERDSAIVKKDPQTKENYYQIKWLDKHRKNYRPRQNTT
jgi:hypothetical protein